MFALVIIIGLIVLVAGLAFGMQGPPFVATDDNSAMQILKTVEEHSAKRIVDLGSGNGKLVIFLATQGYKVDGIELNPLLVLRSRHAIKKAGLQNRASIKWGSFWSHNVSGYDTVVLYAIKHIMPKMEKKLTTELSSGSLIISNFFTFPNLQPDETFGRIRIYKLG